MFNDIKGIIEQNGLDITDNQTGIDLCVTKTDDSGRIKYSIQPMLDKMSVKVTPLTAEELSWKLLNFIEMYDKSYDFAQIKSKMHEDFRIILEMSDEDFNESISATSATDDDNPLLDESENVKKK